MTPSAAISIIAGCAAIVGVIGIGAYLVLHNHLWVGILVIFLGACITVKTGTGGAST